MADSMRGVKELQAALKDMEEIARASTEGTSENIHFVACIQCLGWQLGVEPYASHMDALLAAIRKELKRIVHQKSHGIHEVYGTPMHTIPKDFDMKDFESELEKKFKQDQKEDKQ